MKGTRHIRELLGLLFLFLSLLIGISLWSHNINDPTLNQSISASYEIKNHAGTFGAYLSGALTNLFGLASYLWVLFFLGMGFGFIIRWIVIPWYSWLGYAILSLCFITLAEALTLGVGDVQGGGYCGAWLYATMHLYFNPIGSAFIWLFCLMVGLELCFHISWVNLFSKSTKVVMRKKDKKNATLNTTEKPLNGSKFKHSFNITFKNPFKKDSAINSGTLNLSEDLSKSDKKVETIIDDSYYNNDNYDDEFDEFEFTENNPLGLKPLGLDTEENNKEKNSNGEAKASDTGTEPSRNKEKKGFWSAVLPDKNKKEKAEKKVEKDGKKNVNAEKSVQNKDLPHLPTVDLLSPIPEQKDVSSRASLEEKGNKLLECLADFNVQAKLAGILTGPVVTMYEVRPELGISVKRFERLAQDIAMSIKAVAVRIQAPIPGTDTVGVEVPNDKRQLVSFKEILQSSNFSNSASRLTLGLGKDIFGTPVSVKMDDMPHLLVAGATGAGKSVCLNSIILSILYKAQPHEVQMLLIDPKRVELSMYNGLPHLVHPVVTDMDLARNALMWAVDEMDQRYKLFENLGMRNITEYNAFVRKHKEEYKEDSEALSDRLHAMEHASLQELPFIVIIVDELADLMMQKGKEVEGHIARLGQLARACGMHIILATQRPSVDVITGLIKNNFPARIAFQVSSAIDSRTILDSAGAEALLGKGDMLFKPRAGGLQRIHGAFVTEEEVRAVTEFWKKQAKPEYKIDFSKYGESSPEPTFGDMDDMEQDDMYGTIVDWLDEQDAVSISMIQRRFRLGFSRAGRIIDRLEKDGYIEARSGSKPRKVVH